MRKFISVAALTLLCASLAQAKDLGVQGNTWPIVEIDFRQLMLESASKADLSGIKDEIKNSANKYFSEMPQRNLGSVEKTITRYIDPSIATASDIQAPLPDANGDLQWTVLYAKGTKVNPLTKIRPLTAMLFFNGNSEAQVKFVKETLALNPMRVVPVETAGANVKELSKAFARPIYYANDSMMARFRVDHLPAILYPAAGEFSLFLGLTAFAEPFKQSELQAVWPVQPVNSASLPATTPVTAAERKAITDLLNLSPKAKLNAK